MVSGHVYLLCFLIDALVVRKRRSEGPIRRLLRSQPGQPRKKKKEKKRRRERTYDAGFSTDESTVEWMEKVLVTYSLWGEQPPGKQLWPGS